MAEFPAMPLWTDALIGDTFHLTPAEFGAYMRLLIVAWRRRDCALPNDDKFLGKAIGDHKNWYRLKPAVMPFFTLGADGCFRQQRLLREREYVSRKAETSSAAGRSNALKRWKSRPAVALPLQQRKGNGTSTPTPTPIKKEENLNSTKQASKSEPFTAMPDSDEFKAWERYYRESKISPTMISILRGKRSIGQAAIFDSQWPPDHRKH